jgi:uncharacterized protein (DUF433 family)
MASHKTALDPYGGRDPREIPTYATWEAARYLRIPEQTINNWCFGHSYRVKHGERRANPVIHVPPAPSRLLSFLNMLELHVLDALRRQHRVKLQKVRRAVEWMSHEFKTAHPLADLDVWTDGITVFVERYGALIDASKHGQVAMQRMLQIHLERIERDERQVAIRLFPFTRKRPDPSARAGEPRIVAIDPRVAFGRPVLVGSRIPTLEIAERYKAGESVSELIDDYGRSQAEIEEAIRCELTLPDAA